MQSTVILAAQGSAGLARMPEQPKASSASLHSARILNSVPASSVKTAAKTIPVNKNRGKLKKDVLLSFQDLLSVDHSILSD